MHRKTELHLQHLSIFWERAQPYLDFNIWPDSLKLMTLQPQPPKHCNYRVHGHTQWEQRFLFGIWDKESNHYVVNCKPLLYMVTVAEKVCVGIVIALSLPLLSMPFWRTCLRTEHSDLLRLYFAFLLLDWSHVWHIYSHDYSESEEQRSKKL